MTRACGCVTRADPSCPLHGYEGRPEVWSDEAPNPRRKRYRDPSPSSPAGGLLTKLRGQPGRWLRVAENVGGGWWFSPDASPVNELRSRRLIETSQEPVGWWHRDVWARALTPDEIQSTKGIETT